MSTMHLDWQETYQEDHMRLPPESGFYVTDEPSYGLDGAPARIMFWNRQSFWSPERKGCVPDLTEGTWFYRWYGYPSRWSVPDWDALEWHYHDTDPPHKNGLYWVQSNAERIELAYRTAGNHYVLSRGDYRGRGANPYQTSCYKWAEYERGVRP